MLDIYPFILETITVLRPVAERVARADADLGRQLRRAQASIALNVAEGAYSRGRNRQLRYHTARGGVDCGLCGKSVSVRDIARGEKLAICRDCVQRGLSATLQSTQSS